MQLSDFDFPFDPNLVAAQPVEPGPGSFARAQAVHRRADASPCRRSPALLHPGDLLVLNDTKVVPARITGITHPTGKPVEILFVKDLGGDCWEVMAKGTYRLGRSSTSAPARERRLCSAMRPGLG